MTAFTHGEGEVGVITVTLEEVEDLEAEEDGKGEAEVFHLGGVTDLKRILRVREPLLRLKYQRRLALMSSIASNQTMCKVVREPPTAMLQFSEIRVPRPYLHFLRYLCKTCASKSPWSERFT